MFLLHIFPHCSVTESPGMSHETAEFILQFMFRCASRRLIAHISFEHGFGPAKEVVVK